MSTKKRFAQEVINYSPVGLLGGVAGGGICIFRKRLKNSRKVTERIPCATFPYAIINHPATDSQLLASSLIKKLFSTEIGTIKGRRHVMGYSGGGD